MTILRVPIDSVVRLDTEMGVQHVIVHNIPYEWKRGGNGFRLLREERGNGKRYAVFEVVPKPESGLKPGERRIP